MAWIDESPAFVTDVHNVNHLGENRDDKKYNKNCETHINLRGLDVVIYIYRQEKFFILHTKLL